MSASETLDHIAESALSKFMNKVLMPVLVVVVLPALGYLIVENLRVNQEKLQIQINIANEQFTAFRAETLDRRTQNVANQQSVASTLAETQKALASIQATAAAQYQEIRSLETETGKRIDRLEDWLQRMQPGSRQGH